MVNKHEREPQGEILLNEITTMLGGQEVLRKTLEETSFWARVGDKVWGTAVWTLMLERGVPMVDAESAFQTLSHREVQSKMGLRLGLDKIPLPKSMKLLGQRTFSERLEAVVGRLYVLNENHQIPIRIVEKMIDLLDEDEKINFLAPEKRFMKENPGTQVVINDMGNNSWTVTVYGKNGEILAEQSSGNLFICKMSVLKSATSKIKK